MDKGALHRRLGIREGKPIPTKRIRKDLAKAKRTHNVKEIRQDVFALNTRKGGRGKTRHKRSTHRTSRR